MPRKNNIFIITDSDLDGAGSYMVFNWALKQSIPYEQTTVTNFRSFFSKWYAQNGNDFDCIYILDLDVSESNMDLVDKENITIIDHHDSHVRNAHKYTKANTLIKKETSCSKLILRDFASKGVQFTPSQLELIVYIDDYDSYSLKHENSHKLNTVYWTYQGNRLDKFITDFMYGFDEFSPLHQKIIRYKKAKFKELLGNIDIYKFTKGKYKMYSTFASEFINDVADKIIKDCGADIVFVVNPSSEKVSVRKNPDCDVDLGQLVILTFGDGGGHTYAAGFSLNDKFIEFTKVFEKI